MKFCLTCDYAFFPKKTHPFQKYCSRKCRENAIYRKKVGLNVKLQIINCLCCHKDFYQKSCLNSKFCKKACASKFYEIRLKNGNSTTSPALQ